MAPQFAELQPEQVVVGRGRASAEAQEAFTAAIRGTRAGRITLSPDEKISTVRRQLTAASKALGFKVRSSFNEASKALDWKIVA